MINHDLELKIQCKRKVVNFVDVTLNLENSTYRPYLKGNNKIIYVNTESNHPPSIIKQLPKSVELRLSQLLANKEIFKNSVTPCNETLTKAGYKHNMRYQQDKRQNTTANKNRKINIIWFNPPYSANVVTEVGNHFLSLLDKHFPPHNKFHKIFNRKIIKISYSCLPNMKTIINSYNHKVTNPKSITKDRTKCPLTQNCFVNNIIYKAVSTSTSPHYKEKIYFSTGETTVKLRYSNHQRSSKFLKYKTDTELSSKVWQMKKSEQTPVTTWKIVRRCSPYNPNSKRCYLCLNEKMEIATYRGNNLLNKKTKLISKCRHQNK